jgi:hypothetical protein
VDVASSTANSENVSRTRRETESLHSSRAAGGGFVAASKTGVEKTTRRTEGLTGLKVVGEEEGTGTGEEDGGTGGVEGSGGDGEFGEVEGLKEGVVRSVDLEKTEAAVGGG